MEGPLKELKKLEQLSSLDEHGPSTRSSLDSLLQYLQETRDAVANTGEVNPVHVQGLAQTVASKKKEVEDRQKEIHASMSKLGKAWDKRFTTTLPSRLDLFASPPAVRALERTVALHLLRTGQLDIAETLLEESSVVLPPDLKSIFTDLHDILQGLRNQDISLALEWARHNRDFLNAHNSPLEFYLHRSQYLQLLLSPIPSNCVAAIGYAKTYLQPFYEEHTAEFLRLMGCIYYLPLSKLQSSQYADLASPSVHSELETLFAKEYCASHGMSRQVPLRVVGDIGGGGALARIEKGKKVMRDRKSDWSHVEELPIEIPLPPEHRYHSVFACHVSKERSTEHDPPMMMTCGHVISKDSLARLNNPVGRAKCPYCPVETSQGTALRLYF